MLLDLTNVQATGGPVPAGNYNVVVEKAEVSPTKTGGEMIKVQLKILDGDQAGRNIFDQFNIKNANPQAVQIGLGQLKGMLKAFGFPNPNQLNSCADMIGLKGSVATKIEESPGYDPQARVKGYKALAGAAPVAGAVEAPKAANPFA